MTTENRRGSTVHSMERTATPTFSTVVKSTQAHVDILKERNIRPHIASVAVEAFLLNHFSEINIQRKNEPPFEVTVSQKDKKAVVFSETEYSRVQTGMPQSVTFKERITQKINDVLSPLLNILAQQKNAECLDEIKLLAKELEDKGWHPKDIAEVVEGMITEYCMGVKVLVDETFHDVIAEPDTAIYTNWVADVPVEKTETPEDEKPLPNEVLDYYGLI